MRRHDEPDYLVPFLNHTGSITKKLKALTGSATVQVISGDLVPPDWWSRYFLNLQCDQLFQRDILMTSDDFSCWYARSYIPAATWYQYASFFNQLSKKNLGDMLFDNRAVKRMNTETLPIGKEDLPYYWPPSEVVLGCDTLWLKLSLFSLGTQANFYLTELFLPELSACLQQSGQPIGD